jgi:hypothetical protein
MNAPSLKADTVKFKDGSETEGVIKKVEAGKVSMLIGTENKVFNILDIESMDFNTPHLLADATKLPVDHFLKDVEAQEVVRNFAELERAEADVKSMLASIQNFWSVAQPIVASEVPEWEKEKEEFRKPLSRYQEVLNDIYFHILAKVDTYNEMAKDASKVYVGVKGLRVGSPLITKEMSKLPLTKYVPAQWWDTIFYEGYNQGYEEAYQKFGASKSSN